MTAFADALKAMREVVLLHSRVEQLDRRITIVAGDVDGLTDVVSALRDRMARLEGFIEGAAAVSKRRLPRK